MGRLRGRNSAKMRNGAGVTDCYGLLRIVTPLKEKFRATAYEGGSRIDDGGWRGTGAKKIEDRSLKKTSESSKHQHPSFRLRQKLLRDEPEKRQIPIIKGRTVGGS